MVAYLIFLFLGTVFSSIDESNFICGIRSQNQNNNNLNWPNQNNDPICENYCKDYKGITCGTQSVISKIELPKVSISGTLPDYPLIYLEHLDLSNNELSGSIPTNFGLITILTFMNLSHNKLYGPLWESTSFNLNLTIDLSYNSLESTIPNLVSYLSSLYHLDISNNKLHGNLPTWYGTSLRLIDFSHNNLIGTIPPQIGTIPFLQYLDLSYNQLNGTLPEINNRAYLDISNQKLTINESILNDVSILPNSVFISQDKEVKINNMVLSENSTLVISNSTVSIQNFTTIPFGTTINITNPTKTAIEFADCIDIKPNTVLNVDTSDSITTQTLISFKCKSGTFSKININNQCKIVEDKTIGFILDTKLGCKSSASIRSTNLFIIVAILVYFIFI